MPDVDDNHATGIEVDLMDEKDDVSSVTESDYNDEEPLYSDEEFDREVIIAFNIMKETTDTINEYLRQYCESLKLTSKALNHD